MSIHPLFFVVIILAFIHGFLYEVVVLFTIVIIHELGHACTALSFGWRLKKIELLPFGGVAEVDEHGNRSIKEEALVIVAGPLMNVIMIIVGFLFLQAGVISSSFAYLFIEYNVIILLFNLLPIWPLDGGKLLQLVCSLVLPYKKAIERSLFISGACFLLYVIVLVLFFPVYFSLWGIAIFLLISQWMEWKQSHYQFMRFLIERHKLQQKRNQFFSEEIRDVHSVTVLNEVSLKQLPENMYRHKKHYFCLVNRKGELLNIVSEEEMLNQFFESKASYQAVGDCFS